MRYKIGSFNLRNLGIGGITKRDFDKIANIIRQERFDIVGFQEILSEGKALKYLVDHLLPGWEIFWKEPSESTNYEKVRDKRGEGYAILWEKNRFELAKSITENGERVFEPKIVNEDIHLDCSILARCPLYARLVPVNGGFFEFRIINVHLHFGNQSKTEIEKRKEEYNFIIEKIYPIISMERKYGNNREAYTIILGDYNLNLYKHRGEAEKNIDSSTYISPIKQVGNQKIITVQEDLSTLKKASSENKSEESGYSQNYDHFSFDCNHFMRESIIYKSNRIDAVKKYCDDNFEEYQTKISDHVPVSLEIIMNE